VEPADVLAVDGHAEDGEGELRVALRRVDAGARMDRPRGDGRAAAGVVDREPSGGAWRAKRTASRAALSSEDSSDWLVEENPRRRSRKTRRPRVEPSSTCASFRSPFSKRTVEVWARVP
jgi:hypothetical protein